MKIAVIGNSHIGSLKRGMDMMKAKEVLYDLCFFGARGDGLKSLTVEDSSLVPSDEGTADAIAFTSGGERRIDTDGYDAFLLYGMEARPFFIAEDRYYSSAVLDRAVDDVVEGSLSYNTLQKLRTITDKPIYIGHNPMRGARRNEGPQDVGPYERGIALLNARKYAAVGATLLPQPATTIINGNGTAMPFAQGSKRLAIGDAHDDALHPSVDLNHMNDDFGRLWLTEFFAHLS